MQLQNQDEIPHDPIPVGCAKMNQCQRCNIYVLHRGEIQLAENVLMHVPFPDDCSSNDSSSNSSCSQDEDEVDNGNSEIPKSSVAIEIDCNIDSGNGNVSRPERAYWSLRVIRDAIFGRVYTGLVLKRLQRPYNDGINSTEWEVTFNRCAIKEMNWDQIRRNNSQERPLHEIWIMQYLQSHFTQQNLRNQNQDQNWELPNEQRDVDTFSQVWNLMTETNIMMLLDVFTDDQNLYSIMPFCEGGELFDYVTDHEERFPESECRYWMGHILEAVDNLHRAGICHRDISLENFLTTKDGRLLVIDFGMSLRIPLDTGGDRHLITRQVPCGKLYYMSPEILNSSPSFDGHAVDLWAVGVILFMMLTGLNPWAMARDTDAQFKYMSDGYLEQILTEWDMGLSHDAMDLLQKMLCKMPNDRLNIEQVKNHPFFNGPTTRPNNITD